MSSAAPCALEDLGLLSIRGPDARSFLQGQLSNDLTTLRPGSLLRAGLHNPQGRTLALLALGVGAAPHEILAIAPRGLLASTAATLRRYVLRAKVTLSDESGACRIYGIEQPADSTSAERADGPDAGSVTLQGYARGRALRITPISAPQPALPPNTAAARAQWRALDVAAGLPQVYEATAGQFVAQMLNLDCIGAISFSKGCYTGQEVIARAHYRGQVKRRMQRFLSAEPLHLAAGDGGQLGDGRSFRVVDAAARADGRCEFLAVTALKAMDDAHAAHAAPTPRGALPAEDAQPRAAADAPVWRVLAEALPLPYSLPE